MKTVHVWLLAAAVFAAGVSVGALAVLAYGRAADDGGALESVPRRVEATVYLPRYDNQGRPFLGKLDKAADLFVAKFGGATLTDFADGRALDSRGNVQSDPIRMLVVSFEPGRLDEFRKVLREAGRLLGQESMYVRFEEPRV